MWAGAHLRTAFFYFNCFFTNYDIVSFMTLVEAIDLNKSYETSFIRNVMTIPSSVIFSYVSDTF